MIGIVTLGLKILGLILLLLIVLVIYCSCVIASECDKKNGMK